MPVLRSLQNVNYIVLIGSLMVGLIFVMQVKQIYNNNQKNNRFLGYKQYVSEISAELNAMEKVANESSTYIHRLNEAIRRRDKDTKNISLKTTILS